MSKGQSYQKKFKELLAHKGEVADQLRCYNEAANLAEAHNDEAGSLRARIEYLGEGIGQANYEQNLVHLARCVQICDRNPTLMARYRQMIALLSKFSVRSIVRYAGVTRKQVDEALRELERLAGIAGWGDREIYKEGVSAASMMGDLELVIERRGKLMAMKTDGGEDCAACEEAAYCYYFLVTDELDAALEQAAGLLEGRLTCGSQPAGTDASLLIPLLRAGRVEFAERLQRRSFENVRTLDACFDDTGEFMAYFAATDQLTRGIEMLEAGLGNYPKVRRDWDRFCMLRGARLLLRRLMAVGRKQVHLRVPAGLAWHRSAGEYETEALGQWLDEQVGDIAGRFDARNGNAYISGLLSDREKLLDHITPLPKGRDHS